MKYLGLIFLLLLIMAFASPRGTSLRHHLIVQPTSRVSIFGKTNVNSFQCHAHYCRNDTLILQEGGGVAPVFLKGFVGIESTSFDCGMPLMTSDLEKTIKATDYPLIGIDFKSFERMPTYACKEEKFKGVMTIHISGVARTFDVDCTIEAKPDGLIYLAGSRPLTFADFKLIPPKRMMGMVAVQQEIVVKFQLVLKLDPNAY